MISKLSGDRVQKALAQTVKRGDTIFDQARGAWVPRLRAHPQHLIPGNTGGGKLLIEEFNNAD